MNIFGGGFAKGVFWGVVFVLGECLHCVWTREVTEQERRAARHLPDGGAVHHLLDAVGLGARWWCADLAGGWPGGVGLVPATGRCHRRLTPTGRPDLPPVGGVAGGRIVVE